ncbi:transcription elongation factor spt5 [Bacidia gigantensis]|uniref:transcription elongation factor spt5 n=1 Tax=Bacidia gigantensis TaxID=2732470 RepID=UPI001D058FB4|nr:transcription elongation factor spt5 [Bacidia gigantensis]KAG8533109.1 transcription elongation factor spt5 [Bacidia gigantensis]
MASILDHDFGSESDEGDFNPDTGGGSDNESVSGMKQRTNGAGTNKPRGRGGKDEDGQHSSKTKRRSNETGDDDEGDAASNVDGSEDDEDQENEDEDDEDEEDAISRRPRKRAKKDPRNQYLDVEAEVDEEDEGDDEDEDLQADPFIADTHPDDEAELPDGAPTDDRQHKELDRERQRRQQLDAEEQAELLKVKYGRPARTASDAAIVPRRLLLPSVDDPSIWGVKCKPGKEKEIVFSLQKRMEERFGSKNPLPILSAFERNHSMAGYVYVEARRQADVLKAMDGVMNAYPRTKIVLVPIKEMPDLLRVTKTEQLQPDGYVRIKRGKYAGDLAQIDDVETNGLEASLRIVPRLDYGQNEDNNAPMVDGNIRGELQKRKRAGAMGLNNAAVRPPPRLFSEVEAKKKHAKYVQQVSTMKNDWQYMGDNYRDGFLIKDFKIQHLITENVNPTLEEVTRFTAGAADGTEHLDLSALAQTLKKGAATDNYLPGDIVEVYEGEQTGVVGKAISVRGDIVTISVTNGELLGQAIEVPQKGLRKCFKEGDHVKVIGGSRYQDEVGMVVRIKNDTVTLLSDLSLQEITVFSKDLREASDSGVAGGLGRYDIHDLIQLDPITVACVTKVDRESLRVLDQNGSMRMIMPSQISNKLDRRRTAVATDRHGSEIRTDDTVREIGGEQKMGVILHIYRSFLFLHNREQTENSGISVVRASNVQTVAAKGGRVAQGGSTAPNLNGMNPARMRNGANGTGPMPPPKSFGRDRAIGQTVTVRRGAYKGLLGIIKDTTDTEARVELHTKSKTISIPKDHLGFKDPLTGSTMDYTRFSTSRGGRGGPAHNNPFPHLTFQSRTPGQDFQGSRTPLASQGGRTPAWGAAAASGGRTPAWSGAGSSSARTPAWQQSSAAGNRTPAYAPANDGSRTVNPYADGSRTSYGGGGGNRTPAWNPTATASSFSHDPFSLSGGGRTPAESNGYAEGRAGQLGGVVGRAYDAPTPAASAPTPGASNGYGSGGTAGQTPKFSGDAPTPFGGGLPETPGWSGGDAGGGGPQYEEGTPSP